jgi:hypothetical protein
MRLYNLVGAAVVAASLVACGGGGGGDAALVDDPANDAPSKVTSAAIFQLRDAWNNYVKGTSSQRGTVSGTLNGVPVTGFVTNTSGNLVGSTFEGQAAYAKTFVSSGSLTGNGTTTPLNASGTEYYDMNYLPLGDDGESVYAIVQGVATIPETAKVNDAGLIYKSTNYTTSGKGLNDGSDRVSFVLEPDTETTAILKIITVRNSAWSDDFTSTRSYRITPSGTITAISESATYDTGTLTITY